MSTRCGSTSHRRPGLLCNANITKSFLLPSRDANVFADSDKAIAETKPPVAFGRRCKPASRRPYVFGSQQPSRRARCGSLVSDASQAADAIAERNSVGADVREAKKNFAQQLEPDTSEVGFYSRRLRFGESNFCRAGSKKIFL